MFPGKYCEILPKIENASDFFGSTKPIFVHWPILYKGASTPSNIAGNSFPFELGPQNLFLFDFDAKF